MDEHFICDNCEETEENERKVRLTLESDMPGMTGTRLSLCYRCGIEATYLIADKLIKSHKRPYMGRIWQVAD